MECYIKDKKTDIEFACCFYLYYLWTGNKIYDS